MKRSIRGEVLSKRSFDEFKSCVKQNMTEIHYKNIPLSNLNNKVRGDIIELITKEYFKKEGVSIDEPDECLSINGTKCGKSTREYDAKVWDDKTEIKSSQFQYHKGAWVLKFRHVKIENYNLLVLVAYTPYGLFFYNHDGKLGFGDNGKNTKTNGRSISIRSNGGGDLMNAWNNMKEKLKPMYMGCIEF